MSLLCYYTTNNTHGIYSILFGNIVDVCIYSDNGIIVNRIYFYTYNDMNARGLHIDACSISTMSQIIKQTFYSS